MAQRLSPVPFTAWVLLFFGSILAAAAYVMTGRTMTAALDACVLLLAGIAFALAAHHLFGNR